MTFREVPMEPRVPNTSPADMNMHMYGMSENKTFICSFKVGLCFDSEVPFIAELRSWMFNIVSSLLFFFSKNIEKENTHRIPVYITAESIYVKNWLFIVWVSFEGFTKRNGYMKLNTTPIGFSKLRIESTIPLYNYKLIYFSSNKPMHGKIR